VECIASPGTFHVSEGYHPHWDIDSEDEDLDAQAGNTRVEKERNLLKELLDKARSRRAHSRSLAARLANLTVRDYQYLTEAEKRIRDGKLTNEELTRFLCWEDLAILACDNHERLTQATQEIEVLTTSLTTTQKVLEDERGARIYGEVKHRDLNLEMKALRVGLAVAAQTREAELDRALSKLREHHITAESKWSSERDALNREVENSARIQHELRSELVMVLETHQPPTVGWRIELHNRCQELEATKRELLVARRLIDSLRKGESQPEGWHGVGRERLPWLHNFLSRQYRSGDSVYGWF
jgi:hypothetical protein